MTATHGLQNITLTSFLKNYLLKNYICIFQNKYIDMIFTFLNSDPKLIQRDFFYQTGGSKTYFSYITFSTFLGNEKEQRLALLVINLGASP
jgi:hypothetical protein